MFGKMFKASQLAKRRVPNPDASAAGTPTNTMMGNELAMRGKIQRMRVNRRTNKIPKSMFSMNM